MHLINQSINHLFARKERTEEAHIETMSRTARLLNETLTAALELCCCPWLTTQGCATLN